MSNKINILSTIDKNYFNQYKVLIISILENTSYEKDVIFYLGEKDLDKKQKENLKEHIKKYGAKINFIKKPEVDFLKYNHRKHISEVTHYRTAILENMDIKKIIYLDPDIVVLDDIKKLFDKNLEGKTIGGVKDYIMGLREENNYFNAGVLLIDVPKWKENNYGRRCIEYLEKNHDKLSCENQDTMNIVTKNDKKFLDLRWNRQKWIWDDTAKGMRILKNKYKELIKNPSLIHYTGKIKPWHYKYVFPDKKHYLYYNKIAGLNLPYKKTFSIKDNLWKLFRWITYKTKTRIYVEKILKRLNVPF